MVRNIAWEMRMRKLFGCTSALLFVVVSGCPAVAGHRHRASVPPSEDAVELAGISPPSRRGIALQGYGDAVIARAGIRRRYAREDAANVETIGRTGGAPYPCDPRVATADAYICRNDPRVLGYGQGYAFTPSYVSAPTVFDQNPGVEEPIMPAITSFFYGINSARIDPH